MDEASFGWVSWGYFSMIRKLIWYVHILCTFSLLGLIWLVQVVNYPLFAYVGETWRSYHEFHLHAITLVVMVPMVLELITAILLLRWHRPVTSLANAIFGLILVIAIWLVTMLMSVPAHDGLQPNFNTSQHEKLLFSNGIRSVLWSIRSVWIIIIFHRFIHQCSLPNQNLLAHK